MIKKLFLIIFATTVSYLAGNFITSRLINPQTVLAVSQSPDFAACIAPSLVDYAQKVAGILGGDPNISLLTPAFNASNPVTPQIINAMNSTNAGWTAGLDGYAMNAYDMQGHRFSYWINIIKPLVSLPIYVTETGTHDDTTGDFNISVNEAFEQTGITAALVFNNNGSNPGFNHSVGDYQKVCGSNSHCSGMGVNDAILYGATGIDPTGKFYLAIGDCGKPDDAIKTIKSLPGGVEPIIRIGIGTSALGCEDPLVYVDYLKKVQAGAGRHITAIAGPNEPDLECWIAPQCGCNDSSIVGPQKCVQDETPQGKLTSRPSECGACENYVPDPTLSCAQNFVYNKTLKYSAFNTMNCNKQQCSVDTSDCTINLGGNPIGAYPGDPLNPAEQQQLLVGPLPWNGRFSLDTKETIEPFAGNDNEESRERYIADYVDGTIFYQSPVSPGSSVPANDPQNIYTDVVNSYFDIQPTDPRFFSYTGIGAKLAAQELQDQIKYNVLDRAFSTQYSGLLLPIHNYTIRSWYQPAETARLRDIVGSRRRPLRTADMTQDAYEQALKNWQQLDGGKWYRLWSYVPLASRQDSPGKFVPIPQQPASIVKMDPTGNNVAAGTSGVRTVGNEIFQDTSNEAWNQSSLETPPNPEVELQLPHLARLYESEHLVNMLLAPADGAGPVADKTSITPLAQEPTSDLLSQQIASILPFSPPIKNSESQEQLSQKSEPVFIAQTSPSCQTSNGCYPNGADGGQGCFKFDIILDNQITGNELKYRVFATNTCAEISGSIGDCFWSFNGGGPMVKSIKPPSQGGTTVHVDYNTGGALAHEYGVGPNWSGEISGSIRCNRDVNTLCCPQTQYKTCTYTIDASGGVQSECTSVPVTDTPGPLVCAPTTLQSVIQCDRDVRTGPGDNLCGFQSFDLIISKPDERFWNANPYETQRVGVGSESTAWECSDGTNVSGTWNSETECIANSGCTSCSQVVTGSTAYGDGVYNYNNIQCGAAVACSNCQCLSPDVEICEDLGTGSGSGQYRCYDGDQNHNGTYTKDQCTAICAGPCEEDLTTSCLSKKCCGVNSTDDTKSTSGVSDAYCNPTRKYPAASKLCPNEESCIEDNGVFACVARPYGSDVNLYSSPSGANYQFPSNLIKTLTYEAQREVHVATTLPYFQSIYNEMVGDTVQDGRSPAIKPTYRLLTPYRGPDTPSDPVPWFAFHDGDASGKMQIHNYGGPGSSLSPSTTDFFFPYLGGIQDATQFVRDCLTAPWPNNCTASEIANLYTGKQCVANLSSKMSIFAGTVDQILMDFITTTKPTVIKLFDTALNQSAQVKTAMPPGGVILGRWYGTNGPKWGNGFIDLPAAYKDANGEPLPTSAVAAADQWYTDHKNAITSDMAANVNYWEGLIKPKNLTAARMSWLAQFEIERMKNLARDGQKACIGNFGFGNPPANLWPLFQPAIDAAKTYGAVVCLQEYATNETNPVDYNPSTDTGTMGRYQSMYSMLNMGDVKTIIATTGFNSTAGIEGDNLNSHGWRSLLANDVQRYLTVMKAYDTLIAGDNRIIGATQYQHGLPAWSSFELAPEVIQAMIDGVTANLPEGTIQCTQNSGIVDGPGTIIDIGPIPASGTTVHAGDIIGQIGNTGGPACSTGPHLHLSILDNRFPGQSQNSTATGPYQHPAMYFDPNTAVTAAYTPVFPQLASFGGTSGARQQWLWPVDNPRMSQEYGIPAITSFYNFHNGLDMNYNQLGAPIKAIADGVLVRGTGQCTNSNLGITSTFNRVQIYHDIDGDGKADVISVYLHLLH